MLKWNVWLLLEVPRILTSILKPAPIANQLSESERAFLLKAEMLYKTRTGEMDRLVAHYLSPKRCSWLRQIISFLLSHTERERMINDQERVTELVIIAWL